MKFARFVFLMTVALYIFTPHLKVLAADPDEPTQKLIDSICEQSEDYGFCNDIIHKHLKVPHTDLWDLTYLIFTIGIEQASDTYIFIGDILRERPGPEETAGLTTCLVTYATETSMYLQIRYEYSIEEDYELMVSDILSSGLTLHDCKTDFPVHSREVNPLIEKNREMRIVINMATISGFMVKDHSPSLLSLVTPANYFSHFNM